MQAENYLENIIKKIKAKVIYDLIIVIEKEKIKSISVGNKFISINCKLIFRLVIELNFYNHNFIYNI